jgi:hypothetical protein
MTPLGSDCFAAPSHSPSLSRSTTSAVIGELNEQLDKQIDFSSLRAQPLQHVTH